MRGQTTVDDPGARSAAGHGGPAPPVRRQSVRATPSMRRQSVPDIVVAALAADRARWPMWLPVAFACGIGTYFALPNEPALSVVLALVVPTAVLAWAARHREAVMWCAVLLLVFASGVAAATIRTAAVDTVLLQQAVWANVEGIVERVERRPDDIRLTVAGARIEARSIRGLLPDRVRVVMRGTVEALAMGDRVRLRARLSPPPRPSVPGGYDFQRAAYFDGLGAVGFAIGPVTVLSHRAPSGPWQMIDRVRARITQRLTDGLPGPSGAVAAALLVGERAGLDEATTAAFRDSGLAHLLAISGLHMGLVAGTLFASVRLLLCLVPGLALRWPLKKIAALAALAGSVAYLLLAGAPVPTQRAFVMTGIVLAAILIDREAVTLRLVALSAAAVLLVAPEALIGASFQLSFAAVIALVAVYETWQRRAAARAGRERSAAWRALGRGLGYVGGVASTSLIATVATAPFVTFHFQAIALGGMAANLVAVPLTAFVTMPAGILALLAMPLGLEWAPLALMEFGLDGTLAVATRVVALVGPAAAVSPLPVGGLVAIALGGCWMAVWRSWLRWAGVVPVAVGVAGWLVVTPPDALISSDGRLSAVSIDAADGGWAVSGGRGNGFARSVWQRRWGVSDPVTLMAFDRSGVVGDLACDDLGCLLERNGRRLALVAAHEAALEDCPSADVVIAVVRLRAPCNGPAEVIDRTNLRRDGAHAVWISAGSISVHSVRGARGQRPWVVDSEEY